MGGDCTTGSPLPPGFRFCPTDEELVTHYLSKKAADATFTSAAVRDVDLYKSEPWDLLLPCEAPAPATGTEEERCCYFFCTRSVKYPSGLRTNRATATGYWKSTGKDKEVLRHGGDGDGDVRPVGVKKTLVFHRGRAPRGEKTNWVMHEYRLVQGVDASSPTAFVRGARSEWVICRVFLKKPPGDHHKKETGQYNQEAVLHPPLDHLRPSMAPVPAVSDDYTGHVNSNAISIAPGDHHNTEDMIHRDHEKGLLMNYLGYASPHALLASPVVYLPQLHEYESFSQDLI